MILTMLVSADWVAERIGQNGVTLVDARRPMKYLAGHLPGAINIPAYKLFGADGRLLDPVALADFLGKSGLDSATVPIIYDSPEGQNAAMLAWTLDYLGKTDVHVMRDFFESWKSAGREVLYRPVEGTLQRFKIRPNPAIRVTVEEARIADNAKFVDFRSAEEFRGERTMADDPAGHIPGAVNIVWRELASLPDAMLKSREQLESMLTERGVERGAPVVAYCRSGPRAALGYLALREAGYDVRLFDGSWAEWSRAKLPVEK
jgi:thiosulfate/3-mercaptopyruvate sulfurtransferase